MTSIWFIATIVLIFVELLVTTFVFLPFAVGTFFAGLVSLITDNQNAQLTTFVATKELDPYSSTIQHVYGDDWQVVSKERRIPEGTLVSITNVSGVKLEVEEVEG